MLAKPAEPLLYAPVLARVLLNASPPNQLLEWIVRYRSRVTKGLMILTN